jgi:hypothetical protein
MPQIGEPGFYRWLNSAFYYLDVTHEILQDIAFIIGVATNAFCYNDILEMDFKESIKLKNKSEEFLKNLYGDAK